MRQARIDAKAAELGCISVTRLLERWGLNSKGPIMQRIRNGPLEAKKIDGAFYITMQSVEDAEEMGEQPKPYRTRYRKGPKEGSTTAAAFRMFDAGKDLVEVVERLHVTVSQVDRWYAAYQNRNMRRRYEEKI